MNSSSSIEKIKTLKIENKKLVALLKDSEKTFYQKLKETQKESENMKTVFKQVWPLIKHKVKDPDSLLRGIVSDDITASDKIVDYQPQGGNVNIEVVESL